MHFTQTGQQLSMHPAKCKVKHTSFSVAKYVSPSRIQSMKQFSLNLILFTALFWIDNIFCNIFDAQNAKHLYLNSQIYKNLSIDTHSK